MNTASRIWPFQRSMLPRLALFSLPVTEVIERDLCLAEHWLETAQTPRHREFAAGRICAAAALQALGGEDHWLPIAKPYRYPRFPKAFQGSITHTETFALACAGDTERYLAIGLDAEPLVEHPELQEMARHVLSLTELKQFTGMSGAQAQVFFYLCFSAKEALFKTLFPLCHTDMEFSESELCSWNESGEFTLRLTTHKVADRFEHGTTFYGLWALHNNTLITMLALPRKQALPTLDSAPYVPDFSYGRP